MSFTYAVPVIKNLFEYFEYKKILNNFIYVN